MDFTEILDILKPLEIQLNQSFWCTANTVNDLINAHSLIDDPLQ